MTEPGKPVFLSYASQDSGAARTLCDALRAIDIEVWFDRSELRGGENWDRKIIDQIRKCRLFIPVISKSTEARDEGYFRREWAPSFKTVMCQVLWGSAPAATSQSSARSCATRATLICEPLAPNRAVT